VARVPGSLVCSGGFYPAVFFPQFPIALRIAMPCLFPGPLFVSRNGAVAVPIFVAYALLRHLRYASAFLYLFGTPLGLGSYGRLLGFKFTEESVTQSMWI